MTISTLQSLSKIDENAVIAIFLSEKNQKATEAFLQKHTETKVSLPKANATKGSVSFVNLPYPNAIVLGLGDAPSLEGFRVMTEKAVSFANTHKFTQLVLVVAGDPTPTEWEAISESTILSNYQYLAFKSKKKKNSLTKVSLFLEGRSKKVQEAIANGKRIAEATCITRDLVNEPVISLTAPAFGRRIKKLGKQYGVKVEVWNKTKIKAMKMGGILGVNAGSLDPPTFSIMEYKPKGAKNKKPLVLVGKGVVFDTGGLSLKPTPNSMDFMKSDMAGAGAVVGAICGIASLDLPIHVIGLIPATDNRPGVKAVVPGDVITIHGGSTVEVLHTDAEGRLILADALSYAKKLKPELVIDLATLTGAAVTAVGHHGIAMMSTADRKQTDALLTAGQQVYERLVELPLWQEYGDMMDSDIADIANVSYDGAGAITAGKFLQHFTDYPWIHLDIAGPSWLSKQKSYRGKGGTGTGVRLLINFARNYA